MSDKVRLDQWLWAARFYRTRAMAKTAIDGGKVEIAGQRAKPSRAIHPGDRIHLTRAFFSMEVEVIGLSSIRGDATAARLLYVETAESAATRTRLLAARRLERAGLIAPASKPDKHGRRELRRMKQLDEEG